MPYTPAFLSDEQRERFPFDGNFAISRDHLQYPFIHDIYASINAIRRCFLQTRFLNESQDLSLFILFYDSELRRILYFVSPIVTIPPWDL